MLLFPYIVIQSSTFTALLTRSRQGLCALLLAMLFCAPIAHNTYAETGANATCGLAVQIIAAPFAVVDSNQPGSAGPKVAMLAARIANVSTSTISDAQASIGDGNVAGQFAATSGGSLALLNSEPAVRFLPKLAPGEHVAIYWPVTYPFSYDISYGYTIWAQAGGCLDSQSSQITTQSEISASANKLRPTGSSMLIWPSTIAPGDQVNVQITGFELGTIGQGPKPYYPYDAWLQPIGNLDFDPTCLRLVRSEVKLASVSATPYVNQLYFSGLRQYTSDPSDYVRYTFIVLRACSTIIQPYQEAASGTQEKYNRRHIRLATASLSAGNCSLARVQLT